ncbi:MAG: ATP-binding protein [Chloroflexota bacterium]
MPNHMNDTLYMLHARQQALDLAETPEEATAALSTILSSLLEGVAIRVTLETSLQDNRLPEAEIDSTGCHVTVPIIANDQCYGLVLADSLQPFTKPELALILGQARCAAVTLDRLSWPASPLVFRQLVENANVAIDVADLGGKITYANKAAARMYGFHSPEELIGRSVGDLYYNGEGAKIKAQVKAGKITHGGWIGEVTQQDSNGIPFPVELAIFGLHDPRHKTASFGAILQDVGEYHHLLDYLKQQTQRLASLNRVATLLSSSLDRTRILAMAAEQIVKLMKVDHCGIVLNDADEQTASLVAEYPPTQSAPLLIPLMNNPIFEAQKTEEAFYAYDVPNDPRLDPVRSFMDAMKTQSILAVRLTVNNKLIGSIGLDAISAQRSFSEEELETVRTLASQIALAVENSDLYAQALVANRLKSEFLTTISHELRTPLSPILGYTEMVLSGMYGDLTDKQRDRLQRVTQNAQNLLMLIDDVLDLARIDAGKLTLTFETQDVTPLILACVEEIAAKAEAKNLRLTVEGTPDVPPVNADRVRLQQVMMNLLSNAVKFTQQGSIVVRLQPFRVSGGTCDNIPLGNVTLTDGDWLAISVHDTGIGIASENFNLIFDTFRQVDGSAARQFEGTGLGLAIAQQLVEMHNGKLWVDSVIGEGSTFTIALPVVQHSGE